MESLLPIIAIIVGASFVWMSFFSKKRKERRVVIVAAVKSKPKRDKPSGMKMLIATNLFGFIGLIGLGWSWGLDEPMMRVICAFGSLYLCMFIARKVIDSYEEKVGSNFPSLLGWFCCLAWLLGPMWYATKIAPPIAEFFHG